MMSNHLDLAQNAHVRWFKANLRKRETESREGFLQKFKIADNLAPSSSPGN